MNNEYFIKYYFRETPLARHLIRLESKRILLEKIKIHLAIVNHQKRPLLIRLVHRQIHLLVLQVEMTHLVNRHRMIRLLLKPTTHLVVLLAITKVKGITMIFILYNIIAWSNVEPNSDSTRIISG